MWVVSFTPRPLYSMGKSHWYPQDRRLGGPQSRSERGVEEKHSQPSPGIEHRSSDRPTGIAPSLYRLSYPGSYLRGCIQKFTDWPPGAITANDTALCHYVQLYRCFVSQSSEFCRYNPLCCFSTSVFVVVYFVIDSVRKFLDTPSETRKECFWGTRVPNNHISTHLCLFSYLTEQHQ
jgi:hypothetical protein